MKLNKIIFCGLVLMAGGVLFFSLVDSAGATCICRDSDWDYSGITIQGNCESMCQTWGGVAQWSPPTQDCRTNGCPSGQICRSDSGIWSCMTLSSNESGNGDCSPPCVAGQSCVDFEGSMVCVGDSQKDSSGLPLDTQKDSSGVSIGSGGIVSLPNFIAADSISELILKITKFLMALAIPFAIAMLVWSGFLFATAQGSEDKINKAKNNFKWTIIGIAVILASEALIAYIEEILSGKSGGIFSNMVQNIKDLLEEIIALLFTLVTVYFIWGVLTYVRAAGDETAIKLGKKHMLWGIIGMAIMAAAWPIVALIKNFVQ